MTPIIYNLFPRLVGPTTRWLERVDHASGLGFNWIYLNPWHYPGFSGSLYAPKELWRLNPLFLPADADPFSLEPLREFLAGAKGKGMPVMMDLVINHTSRDSPLIQEHPTWFVRDENGEVVSPSVTDPDDPAKVTVWGDLAEVDNAGSPEREPLWAYWEDVVRRSLELGFAGFRCDAAYKLPAELWARLIRSAKEVFPQALFFAETLGAPEDEITALRSAGFDFFFNSSKWWNFKDEWALEQHESFGRIAPSVAFPESHDTTRLAADSGGDEAVQKQRYAFAAAFSAGVMMTTGYEHGFHKQVNVVTSTPDDWEEPSFDITAFVARVNALKSSTPYLQGEGHLRNASTPGAPVVILERRVDGQRDHALILINTDCEEPQEAVLDRVDLPRSSRLHRVWHDRPADPPSQVIQLERAEVAYLIPAAGEGERS